MIRIAALIIAVLICAAPAKAQDAPDHVLGAPRATQGSELTPDDKAKRTEYANGYYKRCMSVPQEGFSDATNDMTCMCHTVHMLKALKTPELELLGTGKGPVSVNPKRMAVDVYAPCLEFGVVDMEEQACYKDDQVKLVGDTQDKYDGICDCFTRGIGQLIRETAIPHMAALAEMPKGIKDPYYDVMRTSEYRIERNRILEQCIQTYFNPQ